MPCTPRGHIGLERDERLAGSPHTVGELVVELVVELETELRRVDEVQEELESEGQGGDEGRAIAAGDAPRGERAIDERDRDTWMRSRWKPWVPSGPRENRLTLT